MRPTHSRTDCDRCWWDAGIEFNLRIKFQLKLYDRVAAGIDARGWRLTLNPQSSDSQSLSVAAGTKEMEKELRMARRARRARKGSGRVSHGRNLVAGLLFLSELGE